jgi:hypothetical protein
MRKVLSERNWVVILFITALIVFSFAQEDAKKAEKLYRHDSTTSSFIAAPKQTSGLSEPPPRAENTYLQVK